MDSQYLGWRAGGKHKRIPCTNRGKDEPATDVRQRAKPGLRWSLMGWCENGVERRIECDSATSLRLTLYERGLLVSDPRRCEGRISCPSSTDASLETKAWLDRNTQGREASDARASV